MEHLLWKIDECAVYFDQLLVRGWCHHAKHRIVRIELVFAGPHPAIVLVDINRPSPDVAAAIGSAANKCRFDERVTPPPEVLGRDFVLRVTLKGGTTLTTKSAYANASQGDAFHGCWANFLRRLGELPGGEVLEVGSRARSAITYRGLIPPQLSYVGLDILPGPNVDVVGDAHRLEELFGRNRFVAAFSLSVFEHLAMPWKVALELNRVLAPGGLVFTGTHQTWPVHEEPWDFWRFSRHSWQTIFHAASGFEIVEAVCGEPARIHPCRTMASNKALPNEPAWLGSACMVRKTSETALSWPVPLETAASAMYPKGELTTPPH